MADEQKAIAAFLNVKRAQGLAAARAFNKKRRMPEPMPTKRQSAYKPRGRK